MTARRLRVFDLGTPWFWFTIFAQHNSGEPLCQINVWQGTMHRNWWFYFWR